MSPTVSIIVPVYNAARTLGRCVESILNQEYTDFELLLVDDGSTDTSGSLCDAYARQDSRVRVLHRENGGVSAARNAALDAAGGVYLQFLDSDDWMTPDATRSLVRAAEESGCDLVIADFYRVVGSRVSQKGDIEEDNVMTREEYAAHMMENPADFYYGVLWNKLYRRDLVESHHLRMDPEISWCEDFMFNLEYIRCAASFRAIQLPIYYYVKTKGSLATQSLTLSKTVKMKLTVFEEYHRFFKAVLDEAEYEKSRLKIYRFLVDAARDGSVPPPPLSRSQRLGDERMQICPSALREEGIWYDAFRERKLLERYLETAALKNGLPPADTRLLFLLQSLHFQPTRRELADLSGLSPSALSRTLQRLAARGLLKLSEIRAPGETARRLEITLLPAAEPVLQDLSAAQADYTAACTAPLSPEEAAQYARLCRRVQLHIRQILE